MRAPGRICRAAHRAPTHRCRSVHAPCRTKHGARLLMPWLAAVRAQSGGGDRNRVLAPHRGRGCAHCPAFHASVALLRLPAFWTSCRLPLKSLPVPWSYCPPSPPSSAPAGGADWRTLTHAMGRRDGICAGCSGSHEASVRHCSLPHGTPSPAPSAARAAQSDCPHRAASTSFDKLAQAPHSIAQPAVT